jgi:hypothetical protein
VSLWTNCQTTTVCSVFDKPTIGFHPGMYNTARLNMLRRIFRVKVVPFMYPYENLDPERFQKFSQALLVREFPNIQCFPVAQPDGGRDATFLIRGAGHEFRVFQVKFVRNALRDIDLSSWLQEVIEDEIPKIRQLIPKGAIGYHFITNVSGTAHPEIGSIDKLNVALASLVPIPAVAWWRDDLDRRLDNAWELKWTYPELMIGPDLIRAVVESGAREHQERRG